MTRGEQKARARHLAGIDKRARYIFCSQASTFAPPLHLNAMATAEDEDVYLLKAAPSLLEDLGVGLRKLLWKSNLDGQPKPHRRARVVDVWRVFGLVGRLSHIILLSLTQL
jgi:hypothetical protein